jgi:hypothetical protein
MERATDGGVESFYLSAVLARGLCKSVHLSGLRSTSTVGFHVSGTLH